MGRSEPQAVPPDLQPEGHILPSLLQVLHTHQHRDSYLRPGGPESLPECPPWAALSGMRPPVLILQIIIIVSILLRSSLREESHSPRDTQLGSVRTGLRPRAICLQTQPLKPCCPPALAGGDPAARPQQPHPDVPLHGVAQLTQHHLGLILLLLVTDEPLKALREGSFKKEDGY